MVVEIENPNYVGLIYNIVMVQTMYMKDKIWQLQVEDSRIGTCS